jgi:hypothetical protein
MNQFRPLSGVRQAKTAPSVVKVLVNMSVAAAHASNATVDALDATQCEPKRLDAYVGFSRDGEGLQGRGQTRPHGSALHHLDERLSATNSALILEARFRFSVEKLAKEPLEV